jgi:peptidyl-prolyl cis-trans isomerase-like 2
LERLPTDDEDHPLQPVAITSITIFVNPYKDMLEDEKKREAAAAAAAKKRKGASATPAAGKDRHQQQQASDLFSDRATDANLASDDVEGFGDEDHGAWFSDPGKTAAAAGGGAGGVGKYLQLPGTSKSAALAGHGDQPPAKKKSKGSASQPPGAFVNFDAW